MLIWAQKETNNPNKHKVFGYLYSTAKELNLEPPDYKSGALTTWLCHLHGFRI